MTTLQMVLLREDHKSFRAVVKISWFQIVPHVANLPSMKSTDILPWPNPITERVKWSVSEQAGVELWVRRLDAIPGPSPGNKAYKLHWHLEKAARTVSQALLTFGGPWSNHLHAVAARLAVKPFDHQEVSGWIVENVERKVWRDYRN
jgi:hypothetical protein